LSFHYDNTIEQGMRISKLLAEQPASPEPEPDA